MSQQPCPATTVRGAPCRSFVPPGREWCVMHDPAMGETVRAARMKGGTAAAKLRMLQGRRLRLDSPAALVKFTGTLLQDALAGTVDADIARTVLYGVSVQLKAVELTQRADVEVMLAEVRQLTAEARRRGA